MSGRRTERGGALIWALLLLMAAGVIASNVLVRGRALAQETHVDDGRLAALHAAEGGLDAARVRLAEDGAWRGARFSVGRHDVAVQVHREGAGWAVVARSGGVRIDATLRPATPLPDVTAWRARP